MSKHTPGPWAVYKAGDRWGIDSIRESFSVIAWGDDEALLAGTNGRTQDEMEANARLIAAATDLLKAAKEAAAWFQHCELDPACGICPYCIATAAIMKAEGRET